VNLGHRLAAIVALFGIISASVGCSSPGKTDATPSAAGRDGGICARGGIVGWGDSLTYSLTNTAVGGWQQADPTWLETIGEDLGVETKNFGVPSQGSAEIAVRQGGLKPAVTLSDDQIPPGKTNPSAVTAITPQDGWSQYSKAGTMKMHGTLAGVSGTLQHAMTSDGESFSFVPDAAPVSVIRVPPQSTFSGDAGDGYRDCIQLIWAGTNNSSQTSAITRDIASMVKWIADPKRYLIIGSIRSVTNELSATYGPRYIDLQSWLISDGLSAAGTSPTPGDNEAIAAGNIPPSLRAYGGGHFTQAAYTAIGHHLAAIIKAEG
jgi:hypothetical protein